MEFIAVVGGIMTVASFIILFFVKRAEKHYNESLGRK